MPSVITRTIRSMTQDGIGKAPRGFGVWGSCTGLDAGSLHHAQEFLDRRAALDDLAQAVFLEVDHQAAQSQGNGAATPAAAPIVPPIVLPAGAGPPPPTAPPAIGWPPPPASPPPSPDWIAPSP